MKTGKYAYTCMHVHVCMHACMHAYVIVHVCNYSTDETGECWQKRPTYKAKETYI